MLDQIFRSVTFTGLWAGAKRNSIHFLAKIFIFCYLIVFILQLIAFVLARDDLDRLFECLSLLFVVGFGFLKLYSLHFHGATWLNLLGKLKDLEAEEDPDIGDTSIYEYDSDEEGTPELKFATLKKEYEEKFRIMSLILTRIYLTSFIIFMTSPFIEYGFWSLLGRRPSTYPHIVPVWTPLDDVHVAWYIAMVVIEVLATCYCTCVYISFDLTFYGVITFICGQCSILFEKCTRIGGRGYNSVYSTKRDKRAHFRISYAHKTHIILVNAISTLDSLFKSSFGLDFMISTITFCCIALRLKSASLSVLQMVMLLQYAISIILRLYLSCTYGDNILNETSINMGEGPFCAATWCLSPKITRKIILLSMGMSKPRRLQAGPFNTINLPSFVQILRAAYSCYAVVGRTQDQQ